MSTESDKTTEDKFERDTEECLKEMETLEDSDVRVQNLELINSLLSELKISDTRFEKFLQESFGAKTLTDLTDDEIVNVLKYAKEVKEHREKKAKKKAADKTEQKDVEQFAFEETKKGVLECTNSTKGTKYTLDVKTPSCTCPDFNTHREKCELCKHLQAAKNAGYEVREIPAEVKALVPGRKTNGNGGRAKKKPTEEMVVISYDDETIEMPVQIPLNVIDREEAAMTAIQQILGDNPLQENVIERFGNNIEEVAAEVIISLAQHSGIRFTIASKEVEKNKMNLGKIYAAIKKGDAHTSAIAEFMPETNVTTRCKVTAIAAWRDKNGGLRVGTGTKEEYLTVFSLRDIATRGTNFVETTAETKAFKKAIINALPITHDGLLQKIKQTYGWE